MKWNFTFKEGFSCESGVSPSKRIFTFKADFFERGVLPLAGKKYCNGVPYLQPLHFKVLLKRDVFYVFSNRAFIGVGSLEVVMVL